MYCYNCELSTVLMRFFGYPYNDLVICKDSPEYLGDPLLLYANRIDVSMLDAADPQGANSTVIVSNLEDASALDFHFNSSSIFWSEISQVVINRKWLSTNNSRPQATTVVHPGLVSTDTLACDWIGQKLYWIDSVEVKIMVSELDGNNSCVLLWNNLDQPRALALDPLNHFMYWTDWGETPKIEKISMDGDATTRTTIIDTDIYWPNGITVDYDTGQLYWVDAKLLLINACNLDGSGRRVVVSNNPLLLHPFAVTLYQDMLYWTDWESHAILACNKNGTDADDGVKVIQDNIFSPMDLHVYHPSRQPYAPNPCGDNNGGCSHLCLLSTSPPYFSCACPTGVKLTDDGKTCYNGFRDVLLFARRSDIRRISLDTDDHTSIVIPLHGIGHAITLDYDPIDDMVYWTDGDVKTISKAFFNGTGQEVVIPTEVNQPDGIAVDWVARNLYWTDAGSKRIEVARLNGSSRTVLVSDNLEQPRAIVLDPAEGYMYWTDWGNEPKIERAALDGTNRRVLFNTNLKWPNGLALDYESRRIYWGDAHTDRVEFANLDGTGRQVLIEGTNDLPHIFGFGLLNNSVYWSDWQTRSIERIDKLKVTEREIIIEQLPDLMGLKAIRCKTPLDNTGGTNGCAINNGGCSHLCLHRPAPLGQICACPMNYELQSDNVTCLIPEAFLLFTRRDDIRRISLEVNRNEVVIPLANVREAMALDFDVNDNKIYWTDTSLKSINRAFMNGSAAENVIEFGLKFPEGMAVDWVAHNIYWADTGTTRIEMARLDGSQRRVLVWREIVNPRTIALDPPQGHMYWTEWSDPPRIERASLNGDDRVILISNRGRANGLTIDFMDRRLYWTNTDMNYIESTDMYGKNLRSIVLQNTVTPQPFGLTQYEDYLYWADWSTNSIERANKTTGENRTRIQDHLVSVIDILVFHTSRQSGNNSCSYNNGGCSALCIAHTPLINNTSASSGGSSQTSGSPGGGVDYESTEPPSGESNSPQSSGLISNHVSVPNHHCECPTHYSLAEDKTACIAPKTFLLFSQKNSVRRILTNISEAPDMVMPISSLRNIKSLAYNPATRQIFWVDGRTKTIKRQFENGTNVQKLVSNPDNLFHPYSLAIDPFTQHIYWSDVNFNTINVTRIDGRPIGVVVSGTDQKPRAIALAPNKGLMFWTNMQKPFRIERAAMDGTSRVSLFPTGLGTPLALTVDESSHAGKIYWSDEQLQEIYSANMDGSNKRSLVALSNANPVGLAIHAEYLYWIDRDQSVLERINVNTGRDRQRVVQDRMPHLSAIIAVDITRDSVAHACVSSPCSHLCINGSSSSHVCLCPQDLVLSSNKQQCTSPPTCAPNEFACHSGNIDCIPKDWRCDGDIECDDGSDESNCPVCARQLRCGDGQCIAQSNRCDGKVDCDNDGSDEKDCPPCNQYSFECVVDKSCIPVSKICNNHHDCSDGSDEIQCENGLNIARDIHRSTSAQYTVGVVVGAVAMLFIFIFVWFACRRRGYEAGIVMQLDSRNSTMMTKPSQSYDTTLSHSYRGQASGTTCVSGLSDSIRFYDRNHITGASSSSSAVTQYPHETLNPPPSPVTDRSLMGCGSSATDSTVMPYRPQKCRRAIAPPPTTPCSTDIADDDSSYTHLPVNRHYYASNHKHKHRPKHKQSTYRYNTMAPDPYCDTSDSIYSPVNTRHTTNGIGRPGVMGGARRDPFFSPDCGLVYSPSPSTERSFFNPLPPPPSPEATSDQEQEDQL